MAMRDGSVTSRHFENTESCIKLDVLVSPDDVAWADSCLTNDPDISEPNLDSLKKALMEFVSYHSEPLETSTARRWGSGIELSPSSEEKDTSKNFEIHVDEVPINEAAENNNDDIKEKTDTPLSGSYLDKAFLPSYKDEMREIQYSSDSDADLVFPEFAMESSSEIFKVWDLGLPVEEDVFMKQLNKALANSSLKKVTSTFDDSAAGKGFEDDSIDDLVASIADLSLKQRSD